MSESAKPARTLNQITVEFSNICTRLGEASLQAEHLQAVIAQMKAQARKLQQEHAAVTAATAEVAAGEPAQ